MRSRRRRSTVLIAGVILLILPAAPAEGLWLKHVTVTGVVVVASCSGLAYPGVGGVVPDTTTTTKNGPKGEPELNTTVHNGNTCDIGFLSTACIKQSVGKKSGLDLCTMAAVGSITGFCETASGTGTAVLTDVTDSTLLKPDAVTDYKFTWTKSTIRLSGGDQTQHLHAVLSVMPVTGSCTNKTMTGFLMSGEMVIKRITS